jgi:hypothetical protein
MATLRLPGATHCVFLGDDGLHVRVCGNDRAVLKAQGHPVTYETKIKSTGRLVRQMVKQSPGLNCDDKLDIIESKALSCIYEMQAHCPLSSSPPPQKMTCSLSRLSGCRVVSGILFDFNLSSDFILGKKVLLCGDLLLSLIQCVLSGVAELLDHGAPASLRFLLYLPHVDLHCRDPHLKMQAANSVLLDLEVR